MGIAICLLNNRVLCNKRASGELNAVRFEVLRQMQSVTGIGAAVLSYLPGMLIARLKESKLKNADRPESMDSTA